MGEIQDVMNRDYGRTMALPYGKFGKRAYEHIRVTGKFRKSFLRPRKAGRQAYFFNTGASEKKRW